MDDSASTAAAFYPCAGKGAEIDSPQGGCFHGGGAGVLREERLQIEDWGGLQFYPYLHRENTRRIPGGGSL